jgi:hypothetical protein
VIVLDVTFVPAIVTVAVRAAPVFASAVTVMVPLLDPDAALKVSHD